MSVVTMLERLRLQNFELRGSPGYVECLGYRERPCQGERQKKQSGREAGKHIRMGNGCGQYLLPRSLD